MNNHAVPIPSGLTDFTAALKTLNLALRSITASARFVETALEPFSFLTEREALLSSSGELLPASLQPDADLLDTPVGENAKSHNVFFTQDSRYPLLTEFARQVTAGISKAFETTLSPLKSDVQSIKYTSDRSDTKLQGIGLQLSFISTDIKSVLEEVRSIARDTDWIADFLLGAGERTGSESGGQGPGFDPAKGLGAGVDGYTIAKALKVRRPSLVGIITGLILGSDAVDREHQESLEGAGKAARKIRDRATRIDPDDFEGTEEQQRYSAIAEIENSIKELKAIQEALKPLLQAEEFSIFQGLDHPYNLDQDTHDEASRQLKAIETYIKEIQEHRDRILPIRGDQSSSVAPGPRFASAEMQTLHLEVDIKSDFPVVMRRLDKNPNVVIDMYSGPRMRTV
jgi:hypothetical protein